jgi:hypothetical protein
MLKVVAVMIIPFDSLCRGMAVTAGSFTFPGLSGGDHDGCLRGLSREDGAAGCLRRLSGQDGGGGCSSWLIREYGGICCLRRLSGQDGGSGCLSWLSREYGGGCLSRLNWWW